jgi:drug/metabolite transporter (DMT)-like permease
MAALILLAVGSLAARRGVIRAPDRSVLRHHGAGLAAVAVIGGSLPFLLFFEGLSRATSDNAAFIHKTLVIWVALLAVILLKEKVGLAHVAAVAVLIWGQATLSGLGGGNGLGSGEVMILVATLLWSVETVIARRMLAEVPPMAVAVARMAGGSVILVMYVLLFGDFSGLAGMTGAHLSWILVTGLSLAGYVATWFAALARAQAVDVTAVLVGGALITALLDTGIRGAALPSVPAMALIFSGVLLVALAGWIRTAPSR